MITIATALLLTVGFLDNPGTVCTGTLIGPRVVLTAAHCVAGHKPSDLRFTLAPDVNNGKAVFAVADRALIHPAYKASHGDTAAVADIALVRLSSTSYGEPPAAFFPLKEPGKLSLAVAVGYGHNPDGTSGVRRTRHMAFAKEAGTIGTNGEKFPEGMLYFSRGKTGEITCGGDSGAPVVAEVGGQAAIVGVAGQGSVDVRRLPRNAEGKLDTSATSICRAKDTTHVTSLRGTLQWVESASRKLASDLTHR